MTKNNNTVWHHAMITRTHREKLNGHKSRALWFTGLSGSGKSTLAHAVEESLYNMGVRRQENVRRIGEMVKLFIEAGVIAMTAFISPYRKDREWVRSLVGKENFVEIYCDCSLEACESRDVKGLYARARRGEIPEFTGISAPYEAPENPEIHLKTDKLSLQECVDIVTNYIRKE